MQARIRSNSQYKPSVYERPVVRVRFLCPQGDAHHVTYSCTWRAIPGLADITRGIESDEARHFRAKMQESVGGFLGNLGCTITGVELVQTKLVELFLDGRAK